MKDLIIIGAGSVGGHIAHNLTLYGLKGRLVGFLDDDINKQGGHMFGFPVLGPVSWILDKTGYDVIIGIAFPVIKRKIVNLISSNPSLNYPTLIAANSWISEQCKIGAGSIIYPGTCINYGSVIEEFVVVNMNCSIGHNCMVSSFSSLAPGVNLGGYTHLNSGSEMGIGSSTLQGSVVGVDAVVGGQGMVVENIPDHVTAVGVPAKTIRRSFSLKAHPGAGETNLAHAVE